MKKIKGPLTKDKIKDLSCFDRVSYSGILYTARDQAHKKLVGLLSKKKKLVGSVIYYVGPTPKREGFSIGSSGPASSYRMDKLAVPLMEKGLKIMIGKGDRSEEFKQEMIKNNACYLIATGGIGALLSSKIVSSELILYEDLGAGAVYKLEVKDFPCFVAYDIYGKDIFKDK